MVAVFILLFLYSLIDIRHPYYGNIATAFAASLVGSFLFVAIGIGIVEYTDGTTISDTATAFILLIPTIIMMAYTALMIYDAYIEWKEKEDEI
jgi:putative effector of murein hydrolase LrgA (UPF0299 family)